MIVDIDISKPTAEEELRADRNLLVAISLWARHVGWKAHWMGWMDPAETVVVCLEEGALTVKHRHPRTKVWPLKGREYVVDSVRQGVDVLCALGILPVEFSTGWHVGQRSEEIDPAPGIVRVWDHEGNPWDRLRRSPGIWWEDDDGYTIRWDELVITFGPISLTPAVVVGGEPE